MRAQPGRPIVPLQNGRRRMETPGPKDGCGGPRSQRRPYHRKRALRLEDPKRQRMVEKSSLRDEVKMHPPQASEKRREFDLPEATLKCNIKYLIRGGANGFEPEISLTVLPRTQSETPVRCLLRLEQPNGSECCQTAHERLPSRATIVSRGGRTPGGAERSASVRVASEFLPIEPPQQMASASCTGQPARIRARGSSAGRAKSGAHASNGRSRP